MNDVEQLKTVTLCPESFYPEEQGKEIEKKAFEIYTSTVSKNILCPNQTSISFDYIVEEAFDAARAFIREAKYQSLKPNFADEKEKTA